jgi:uncharacterized membrane protein
MNPTTMEWIHLALRWIHVFAGILWVGQTFFFTWLDARLNEEELATKEGRKPQVWMVHSGGFYVMERQKGVELLPRTLYWFKWEAALTWLSGFLLLGLIYHMGGLMVEPDSGISVGRAAGIGTLAIILGWVVYDLLWVSPLGKNEAVGTVVSYALLVALTYGLTQVMSGRAAWMHVGAVLGTIMTANVWMRILPGQRRMVAAVQEGRTPDRALATRAKQRSRHNTFLVFPVVAIMISNHFPVATYGNTNNWLVLAAVVLIGWAAAFLIRRL